MGKYLQIAIVGQSQNANLTAMSDKLPKGIHRLYQSSVLEAMAFAYIQALYSDGGFSQEEAAKKFQEWTGLTEDQASIRGLVCIFHRKREIFTDAMRLGVIEADLNSLSLEESRLLSLVKKAVELHEREKDKGPNKEGKG